MKKIIIMTVYLSSLALLSFVPSPKKATWTWGGVLKTAAVDAGGALSGALTGVELGTVICPGVGTGVAAGVGAVIGGAAASCAASRISFTGGGCVPHEFPFPWKNKLLQNDMGYLGSINKFKGLHNEILIRVNNDSKNLKNGEDIIELFFKSETLKKVAGTDIILNKEFVKYFTNYQKYSIFSNLDKIKTGDFNKNEMIKNHFKMLLASKDFKDYQTKLNKFKNEILSIEKKFKSTDKDLPWKYALLIMNDSIEFWNNQK